jgi:hypothetical protein
MTDAQWDDVLIGGNHLANYLIGKLGGGFGLRFSPRTPPDEARAAFNNDDVFDVWCCWAAIMRTRDALTNG